MKQMINLIVLNVFLLTGVTVISEPIACPPGRNCEVGLDRKIERDLTYATLVVLGSFERFSGSKLEPLSDGTSLINTRFSVDEYYKGRADSDVLNLKIPVYTPLGADSSKGSGEGDGKQAEALFRELQSLERELERGRIGKPDYESKVKKKITAALRADSYGGESFFIVPIARGGLDHTYRQADVPVVPGKKYVLFIFKSIDDKRATALFTSDIDLYSEDNIRVVKQVLNVFEKGAGTGGATPDNGRNGS